MRWRPEGARCSECGFDWSIGVPDAIVLVAGSPERVRKLLEGAEDATKRPSPGVWSPNGYLWHLVDVLRIGAERLLTASLDPTAGIPCWDENALAEVRRYDSLSPKVGLSVYHSTVTDWVAIAEAAPPASSVAHARFGVVTAEDLVRRNAHEVEHHELDIRRGLQATSG
jgi:hypothetical protein